ncbi:hypothetical protein H1R20_g15565, partial [Candolleomyces eurysporus]
MSDDRENHLITLMARAIYANFTISMVAVGIHLFMALYGLSVFLETPELLRKGPLITICLLCARRILAKLVPSADVQVYTGVIAILIESAAPLTVFGIITAAITLGQVAGILSTAGGITVSGFLFEGFFYSFCTLSPHMIIFRVTTGRSFTKFPSVKDGFVTNPIQFARRTAKSSFLQSTLNREFGRNRVGDTEQGPDTSEETSTIHIAQEKRNNGGDVEKVG